MSKRGNNEGSIRHREDGSWEGRYSVGYHPKTGKRIRRSVYAPTRRECNEKLKKAMERTTKGLLPEAEKLTVADWLAYYLWNIKEPTLKPGTFAQYVETVKKYLSRPKIVKMRIREVQRFHVQEFVDGLSSFNSPFVVRNVYAILRNAFKEAERRGIVAQSYAGGVMLPQRKPKAIQILTIENQQALLKAIEGHRLEAAFIVAMTTGIREGELTALRWSDYTGDNLSVSRNALRVARYDALTEEKTGSEVIIQDSPKTLAGVRVIPLLPITIGALDKHRERQEKERSENISGYEDTDLIFCNEIGRVYDPSHYRKELQKILKAEGLPIIRFHALRHSFATRGLEAGIPAKAMQSILGHETPDMVMHYQHLLASQARIEMDKLKDIF